MTQLLFSKSFYSAVHRTLIKSKCWVLKIRPPSHFLVVMPYGIGKWNPSSCKSWTCLAYLVHSWWSLLNIRTQNIISHGADLVLPDHSGISTRMARLFCCRSILQEISYISIHLSIFIKFCFIYHYYHCFIAYHISALKSPWHLTE